MHSTRLCFLFLATCFPLLAPGAERPNILWLSAEDHGPHLGCYGDSFAVTPNVDAFSVQAVADRVKHRMPRFYRIVGSSMLVGCGGATFFFCNAVIGLDPWYDPRYLIPLAGMIIGNSMTGASLAAERLAAEMRERREEIETALCLGATACAASREAVRSAYRAALIPSINAMAAMGLVFLPGMMTGQILSGTEPITAVKYQIAVMCVITGSVAVTSFLILLQGYRAYFTPAHQFREEG
jgi:putative ABC transport system permease protein